MRAWTQNAGTDLMGGGRSDRLRRCTRCKMDGMWEAARCRGRWRWRGEEVSGAVSSLQPAWTAGPCALTWEGRSKHRDGFLARHVDWVPLRYSGGEGQRAAGRGLELPL